MADLIAAVTGLLFLRSIAFARDMAFFATVVAGGGTTLWAIAGLMRAVAAVIAAAPARLLVIHDYWYLLILVEIGKDCTKAQLSVVSNENSVVTGGDEVVDRKFWFGVKHEICRVVGQKR